MMNRFLCNFRYLNLVHILYKVYILFTNRENIHYRKIQGLVGEHSFSIVLPKSFAIDLGIGKGDFVKVSQEQNKIIIEKA